MRVCLDLKTDLHSCYGLNCLCPPPNSDVENLTPNVEVGPSLYRLGGMAFRQ